jgi:hypothetical protein
MLCAMHRVVKKKSFNSALVQHGSQLGSFIYLLRKFAGLLDEAVTSALQRVRLFQRRSEVTVFSQRD